MIVSCWDILSQIHLFMTHPLHFWWLKGIFKISPSHKTIDLLLLFDSYKYNHFKPKMCIRDSNKFVSIFESQKHLAKRNFNLSKNIFVWNLQFVFTMKNTKEMELEWGKAKISAHLFLSLNVEESKVYSRQVYMTRYQKENSTCPKLCKEIVLSLFGQVCLSGLPSYFVL